MCFAAKPPKPRPLPTPPARDDDAIRMREDQERMMLASQSGRSSTIRTDLTSADVSGTKKVLLGV